MDDKVDSLRSVQNYGDSMSDKSEKKKFSVDMNLVFFGIIATAFLFTLWSDIFPKHTKTVSEPVATELVLTGVISAGKCDQEPKVLAFQRGSPVAEGKVLAIDSGWSFELPVPDQPLEVYASCEGANTLEASQTISKPKDFAASSDTLSLVLENRRSAADSVGQAALKSAKGSVSLAIGLIGYIALFLGLMKIVEKAGGLQFMARMIRPLLVRLFPDVPPDHPAMGAMVMNIAANALGLGNAATPFGLKAMKELNDLNPHKGTATNAMCLFLAINTSGLALLPTGIIGLRAQFGSMDPAAIFPTTLMATGISTLVGVFAAKSLSRLFPSPAADADFQKPIFPTGERTSLKDLIPLSLFGFMMLGLVTLVYTYGSVASAWIMPVLIFGMVFVGVVRRVPVYEAFIEGAKEGFNLGVMIIPYLVAILTAIGMFRASGGLETLVIWIAPLTDAIRLPGEALPLALLRPLSGSGAFGITAELVQSYGPDSYIGNLVSTMNGSTETTFYVLAVYFGSVGVHRYRHALWAGLAADITGVFASIIAVNLLLGGWG